MEKCLRGFSTPHQILAFVFFKAMTSEKKALEFMNYEWYVEKTKFYSCLQIFHEI